MDLIFLAFWLTAIVTLLYIIYNAQSNGDKGAVLGWGLVMIGMALFGVLYWGNELIGGFSQTIIYFILALLLISAYIVDIKFGYM